MALGAQSYYMSMVELQPDWTPRFPNSIGPNPFIYACQSEMPSVYNPTDWASSWNFESWVDLNFQIDVPFYYSYSFISRGNGANATFTARAEGDLDCDNYISLYEITGHVDNEGQVQTSVIWTNVFTEFE